MSHHNTRPSLDVRALARSAGVVRGSAPLSHLARLGADTAPTDDDPLVSWEAQGEWRTPAGEAGQVWLHLLVRGEVPLVCQRCMEVVRVPLDVDRWFRFAPDEEQAQAWDEDSEEDVLSWGTDFHLQDLVEDEALLSLPLVPRHEVCPSAPRLQVQDPGFSVEAEAPKAHPFAGLAALRGKNSR